MHARECPRHCTITTVQTTAEAQAEGKRLRRNGHIGLHEGGGDKV